MLTHDGPHFLAIKIHYNWNKTACLIVTWRSLNNSIHFNLLRFKLLRENVKPSTMRPTPVDANLGHLSVWSISTLPAWQLTHHSAAAAAARAAVVNAVRWMGLIVTHCMRMNCHLAATVIRSVKGLGLYLDCTCSHRPWRWFHYSVRTAHDDNMTWPLSYLFIAVGREVGVNFDFRVNNRYLLNLVTSV